MVLLRSNLMRTSRRGLVDLIVMIVMIVLLVGIGTLAYLTYERAEKERAYLRAQRDIPARQQAEIDAVKARFAEVSRHIGFRGDGAYSSAAEIRRMLRDGQHFAVEYYDISAVAAEDLMSGTEMATINVRVPDGTGGYRTESRQVRVVRQSRRVTQRLYDETLANVITLEAAIGSQDIVINELFQNRIPALAAQRERQMDARRSSAEQRSRETDTLFTDLQAAVGGSEEAVSGALRTLVDNEGQAAQAGLAEAAAYGTLDSPEVRRQRDEAFAVSREAAIARRAAIERQDAYRVQADKRRQDDSRDPDGSIFLVDERSGYVWINIGQRSGVSLNQTFQVIRPDPTRATEVQIGEIRVQEIMRGNIARARVDALDDSSVYPRQGDLIRNPNFTARQYQSWALVGQFGGDFSPLTRAELVELMRSVGWQVHDRPTFTTDAVIIGGNWQDDPDWERARQELNLNVETFTVEEILFFLGEIGPDRRD
jgi:hypothetical protein